MSLNLRDSRFDLVICAGPRAQPWPSVGATALSTLCSQMGLKVGVFGGTTHQVRGAIPLPGTGGLIIIEDAQNRLHRIEARAIVRMLPEPELPDPFPGWRSPGLIPLSTAVRLRAETAEGSVPWDPATVILGSGNRALRFGSALLESGAQSVYSVETVSQWGAKRFSGWEVERRRFETLGGRLLEAQPLSLTPKAALLWELRLRDTQGVRVLDVARVVSAGPFRASAGVREHPPGSFLFELEQTAPARREDDVEGWVMEEQRGLSLAGKIVRALVTDLAEQREDLDRITKRARGRLKRYLRHREEPFTPGYQGKWMATTDAKRVRAFSGTPQTEQRKRLVASVECFEEIPCNVCATICPENAIEIGRVPRGPNPILKESACTGCGLCLNACPSGATLLLQEPEERSVGKVMLPWRGERLWRPSEFATLLNRRGESLGTARVLEVTEARENGVQRVTVEVPTHLIWEARALRKPKAAAAEDQGFLSAVARSTRPEGRVEISLNGERRLVRDEVPITIALFESGQSLADDTLSCVDGSCGLCQVTVDGVKKLACQTTVHRGMAIRQPVSAPASPSEALLCPCLGVTVEEVVERMKQGRLGSPEAVVSVTHVGEGRCHGQLCMGAFRRLLEEEGLDTSQWIDWRFPWVDWTFSPK